MNSPNLRVQTLFVSGATHRVVQPGDVQHHRLGSLVGGAQEELRLPPPGRSTLHPLRLPRGRLEELVHLRGQQLRLPRGGGPATNTTRGECSPGITVTRYLVTPYCNQTTLCQ